MAAAAAGLQAGGLPGYADVHSGDWYAGWVAAARGAALIGPDSHWPLWTGGSFGADLSLKRAEAATLIANLLLRMP